MLDEQKIIEILWGILGWSLGAMAALVGVIYWHMIYSQRKLSARVDKCALQEDLKKLEKDLKEDRRDRDQAVDKKFEEVIGGIRGMHSRMDDLYKHLLGGGR